MVHVQEWRLERHGRRSKFFRISVAGYREPVPAEKLDVHRKRHRVRRRSLVSGSPSSSSSRRGSVDKRLTAVNPKRPAEQRHLLYSDRRDSH
jgi:hypothetical protein